MPVEVIGLKEANAALRRLPDFVKAEAQHVMDVTAFQVQAAAQQSAPVRTGLLRRSIQWASRPRSLSAVVGIGDALAFYWKFLEYGTVKTPARPFLRPAAERFRKDHETRMIAALERAATKVERSR